MARKHILQTEDINIEQKKILTAADLADREPEIVLVDKMPNKDWADAMEFNEEPVTIRLERAAQDNAPLSYPVWVNGKGGEVFQNGRWHEIVHLPVDQELITKRKYVANLISCKFDRVETDVGRPGDNTEVVKNNVNRRTSAVANITILEDNNPRGKAFFQELRRRNF